MVNLEVGEVLTDAASRRHDHAAGFSAIKLLVDREWRNGLFWLTGLQKSHLIRGITESLAGRVAIPDLPWLKQAELDGRALSASLRHFFEVPIECEWGCCLGNLRVGVVG